MKRYLLLLLVVLAGSTATMAQDDELPPPSSKPKIQDSTYRQRKSDEFRGFKKHKKIDFSKFIIEPNFNFGLGQNWVNVGLSPYVGYNVWKGLCVGGGITYLYTGFSNEVIPAPTKNGATEYGRANDHMYGGGVFLQYNIYRGFFARTRFEVLHRDIFYTPYNPDNFVQGNLPRLQKTIPSLLIGVGYNLLQSKNFFFPVMVSYNVLHSVTESRYSVYPRGLVVQLGFVNVF